MSIQASFFPGAYSIGKSDRSLDLSHREDIPGPGQYNVSLFSSKIKAPQWKLSPKSKRSKSLYEATKNNQPSPFSYNFKSSIGAAPKYTFGGKPTEKKSSINLGPGAYNPLYQSNAPNPSFSMGYKEEFSMFGLKPDQKENSSVNESKVTKLPSVYNDDLGEEKKKKLTKSEKKSPKNDLKNKDVSKFLKEKRTHSTDRIRNDAPGPGFYKLNYVNMINGPKISFPESLRDDFYALKDKSALGPGSFQIVREFDSKSKLANSTKKNKHALLNLSHAASTKKIQGVSTATPGPGFYNPEKILTKIAVGFKTASRKVISHLEKVPGPGAYTPEVVNISKSIKFPQSNKESSYINSSNPAPGPGKYDVNESFFKNNYSIVMKPPLEKSLAYQVKPENNPGPAHYDPNYDFLMGKGSYGHFTKFERFLSQKKLKTNEKGDIIGPGKYYREDKRIGPKYSFPKNDETNLTPSLMKMLYPGPGSYEIQSTIGALPNYLK